MTQDGARPERASVASLRWLFATIGVAVAGLLPFFALVLKRRGLTPDRMRLMSKTNRNNRLSTEALESTGFRFSRTDFAAAVADNVDWYRSKGWLPSA